MTDVTRARLPQTLTTSPQQAAPLSWFTGPQFALVLGVAILVQALPTIAALWDGWSRPALQLVALPFFVAATVITSRSTRANGREFTLGRGVLILTVASAGMVISAVGASGGTVHVEHWWSATAVSVVFGGLTPICSALRLVLLGVPLAVVVGATAALGFIPSERWLPGGVMVIGASPVIIGVIACVSFVVAFLRLTRTALETLDGETDRVDVAAAVTPAHEVALAHPRMAAASADGVAFLSRIADAGVVTDGDRAEVQEIALQLRSTLVTAATRSWLDVVADTSGISVVDPDGSADWMDASQRTALRGLLAAVVDNPVVDKRSVRIELRGQEDGSVAVAVRLDVDLPEGRRVMMLAPYYLALKTTVDGLSWADGRQMLFRFQIHKPPRSDT
jgi:hypothetical protein